MKRIYEIEDLRNLVASDLGVKVEDVKDWNAFIEYDETSNFQGFIINE